MVNQTYRPGINTFYASIAFALLLLFTIQAFLYGSTISGFSALAWSLGIGFPTYFGFIKSRIDYSLDGVIFRNPFSTIQIPWNEIEGMDDQLNFIVLSNGKKYSAWIAPSKRKMTRRGFYRMDRIREASSLTAQDLERREFERTANPALFIAQEFQKEFLRSRHISQFSFFEVVHKERIWNIALALATGALLALLG